MTMQKTYTHNFEVLAQPQYVASESKPNQDYHFFAYKITIKNLGTASAQLLSRHWIITDGNGRIEEVRGPGVIGLQPKIQPGQSFQYESACPLSTPHGSMRGSYQMVSELGESFEIEIPEFYLISPQALH